MRTAFRRAAELSGERVIYDYRPGWQRRRREWWSGEGHLIRIGEEGVATVLEELGPGSQCSANLAFPPAGTAWKCPHGLRRGVHPTIPIF